MFLQFAMQKPHQILFQIQILLNFLLTDPRNFLMLCKKEKRGFNNNNNNNTNTKRREKRMKKKEKER